MRPMRNTTNGAMIDYNFTKGEAALEYMKTSVQAAERFGGL